MSGLNLTPSQHMQLKIATKPTLPPGQYKTTWEVPLNQITLDLAIIVIIIIWTSSVVCTEMKV